MTRKIPDLSEVLFPVTLAPIFLEQAQRGQQLQLFEAKRTSSTSIQKQKAFKKVPKFRAVVAKDDGSVFTVVSGGYRLVSNQEALDLGAQCFKQIFKLTAPDKMGLYNIIMPRSRSFCHVDYIHKDKKYLLLSKDDVWYPYLRITNSYNKTYALNFKIGFCRWICSNGMIFGGKSIDFKFHHSKQVNNIDSTFRLRTGEFVDLEKKFLESIHNLERYHVPPRYIWRLVCKVFGILYPNPARKDQIEIYSIQKHHIAKLSEKYFSEMGQNGYAALNILTDFATRPVGCISAEQRVDSMQSRAGDWVEEFIKAIEDRSFSFDEYLKEFKLHAA